MRRRFSRLSLLTKVMLSTSVAITVLFAVTGEIVLRHITQTMSQSLEEEVRASFQSYTSSEPAFVGGGFYWEFRQTMTPSNKPDYQLLRAAAAR